MARSSSRESLALSAIRYLFEQAKLHMEYEHNLIRHAESYSRRHRVPIPKEYKMQYCKKCRHIYSKSAIRRIKGDTLLIHCDKCGAVRRIPLDSPKKEVLS